MPLHGVATVTITLKICAASALDGGATLTALKEDLKHQAEAYISGRLAPSVLLKTVVSEITITERV